MAQAPPLYDLMLLLDADAPSERRAEILQNVQSSISGQGSIERNDDWGVRTLAYEIEHRTEAAYHLFQFTGPPALLEALQHNLKVTDGVIRHRIIRVLPGTPPPPPPPAARTERPAEAPPAAEPAEAPAAEPAAAEPEAPAAPASEEPAPPAEAPAG
jgi:small subunit ribosomal protein S6